jgi:hypothetical protein
MSAGRARPSDAPLQPIVHFGHSAGHGTVSPRQGLRLRPSRNGVAAIRTRPFLPLSE